MWEHRSSPRVPASGEVLLFLNGMPVLSGEVRNVCRDGLFVATRAAGLSRNDYVELELHLERNAGGLRFPAMVIHCGREGIGLTVDRGDRRAARAVQALMEGSGQSMH